VEVNEIRTKETKKNGNTKYVWENNEDKKDERERECRVESSQFTA
jgi:hypothetical protein